MLQKWWNRLKYNILKNIFLYIALTFTCSSYAQGRLTYDTCKINNRKNGKKEGMWQKKYFLSDKLQSTCEYKNGKKSGAYYKYYKSGFLKVSGEYINNRKSGTECFYRDKVRGEAVKHCISHENRKRKRVEIIWGGDM
jgi:antitoxin component YwqK of YwqJK toxin-antitoxin module